MWRQVPELKTVYDNEWERIWKGASVAWSGILSRNSWGKSEESNEKLIKIVGIPSEIRTGHLPNTSEKLYRLSQFAQ
jgi:hypothetical protein